MIPMNDVYDIYGNFRTRTFSEIFSDADDFNAYLTNIDSNSNDVIADIQPKYKYIWLLLAARYANSHIASINEDQFKLKVWLIVHQYAPNFIKKLDLQVKIREMSDEDLMSTGLSVMNHANNPSAVTDTPDTLVNTVDDQNTSTGKRDKSSAYMLQYDNLDDSLIDKFLDRFKRLFLTVVEPDYPLWYEDNN